MIVILIGALLFGCVSLGVWHHAKFKSKVRPHFRLYLLVFVSSSFCLCGWASGYGWVLLFSGCAKVEERSADPATLIGPRWINSVYAAGRYRYSKSTCRTSIGDFLASAGWGGFSTATVPEREVPVGTGDILPTVFQCRYGILQCCCYPDLLSHECSQ